MNGQKRILLITHPEYLKHDTGGDEHPDTPERLLVIREALEQSLLKENVSEVQAREAEREWLTVFHEDNYLFRFEESALSGKKFLGHRDNQLSYETFHAALFSAGAGLAAIDLIEQGNRSVYFCCVRPPGHHAERNMALGFCFLNNIVIAAEYWQRKYNRHKILIFDFDAHHGNGIQAAFEENSSVFYVSIHEHPNFSFPGTGYQEETGSGSGIGTTLNIPLPPGAGDPAVLKAMKTIIEPAVEHFQPDCLLVAAGFDGHIKDDMSGLAYSTNLYEQIGEILADWSCRFCDGRMVSILEGGYHLQSLGESVTAYLAGILRKA